MLATISGDTMRATTTAGRFAPSRLDAAATEWVASWDDRAEEPWDRPDTGMLMHYNLCLAPEARERGGLTRCTMCGANLRYVTVVAYLETGEYFVVGDDCAENLTIAKMVGKKVSALRARAAAGRESAKRAIQREEYLQRNPDVADALTLAERSDFLDDMVHSLRECGHLTERQAAVAVRIARKIRESDARREAEKDLPTAPAPSGLVTVEGEIVYVRTDDGYMPNTYVTKVVVRDDRGFKVWATRPRACAEAGKGDRIRFTATVTPSDDDETFGFAKRPTKAAILT